MRPQTTTRLGELIAAVFDEAADYSSDPTQISRLATDAVRHLTRHGRRITMAPPAGPLARQLVWRQGAWSTRAPHRLSSGDAQRWRP